MPNEDSPRCLSRQVLAVSSTAFGDCCCFASDRREQVPAAARGGGVARLRRQFGAAVLVAGGDELDKNGNKDRVCEVRRTLFAPFARQNTPISGRKVLV
jgi:hypothetical protein